MPVKAIRQSRKHSKFARTTSNITFSLADYRNNYFMSDDPNKIIEFYNGFENRDQLIQWMRERPNGVANTHEVEGDKDIIVVIPTADFNGKYAKECRENIFKDLHMVFVESGEVPDPYFNYAHNCNVGIRKAMEYSPKWIVFSNDDMQKLDNVNVLKTELDKLDNLRYDVAFPAPSNLSSNYHTVPLYIAKKRVSYEVYLYLYKRQEKYLYNKFNLDFFYSFYTLKSKLVFRKVPKTEFVVTMAFTIMSSKYIKNLGNQIFDETYINEHEDLDLSFRFILTGAKTKNIHYEIRAMRGSTFGFNICRGLRSIAGRAYFNFKYNRLLKRLLR